mmetsp:Transcript_4540/g.5030  ORF Transcript_4540/g.5030 Transcript_4540/m.5030 type:complete len:94 (+) Transcript_4540:1-282(+)
MCSNWFDDGEYDFTAISHDPVRVQVHLNSMFLNVPSRKVLAQRLKFKCFAALSPLCSQRVGGNSVSSSFPSSTATTSASWRNRDTDITYSGYM